MSLEEVVAKAQAALGKRDYRTAASQARKAMKVAGCTAQQTVEGLPKWSAEVRELGFQAVMTLARALLAQGKWSEAQRAWVGLAGMDRAKLAPLTLLTAEAYFRGGDWRFRYPQHHARGVLDVKPPVAAAVQVEALVAIARFDRYMGFYADAAAGLDRAEALLADVSAEAGLKARLPVEQGMLALWWRSDTEEARRLLERAVLLDGENAGVRMAMGELECAAARPEAAFDWLRPMEPEGDAEVLAAMGRAHGLMGDWKAAARCLERALERAKGWYGESHPITGWLYGRLGAERRTNPEEAMELLERAQVTLRVHTASDHPWTAEVRRLAAEIAPLRTERAYASPFAARHLAVRRQLEALHARVSKLCGDRARFQVGEPCGARGVASVEQLLGRKLPDSFRDTLIGLAGSVEIAYWCAERGRMGCLNWDVSELPAMQETYREWVDPEESGKLSKVLRKRLAILEVGNGDWVTIDCGSADGAVFYFDHEDPEAGAVLAPNFAEFLRRVLYLGAVGDHSYRDFLGQDGLDVASDRAREWHAWIYGES